MRYGSDLYDLPVIHRISGQVVGYVREIVCKPGEKRVEGIVYEERSLLHRCRLVPWQAVSVIGDKSVVIDASAGGKASKPVNCDNRESNVYNTRGNYMGRISNYLIDEKTGNLLGMELSASMLDDLKFGRKIIENKGTIMQGENFLMMVGGEENDGTMHDERRSEDEGLC